jgi:DNA (cytosine-5)-methyltransferase 1
MMRALDLFCGAGGATKGLQRAGFHVTGVDIKPQPRYCGNAFVQADALRPPFDLSQFNFIWASPPCQGYTTMSNRYPQRQAEWPRLVEQCRALGCNVIENVPGSTVRTSVLLHGGMFGLDVYRPRVFETSFFIFKPQAAARPRCDIGVYGARPDGRRLWTRTDGSEQRAPRSTAEGGRAMGIDWMEWDELKEAIPPAYSEFIGRAALQHLRAAA